MSPSDNFVNIADANRPNAGRIYDFLLGGNHNFEIDRQAAQGLLKLAPSMGKTPKMIRWFLGEAVRRLSADGFNVFLDFASGLPTVDHIHQVAPAGTRVVYSDLDPVTVAYAQDLIGDSPNIRFIQCDAGKPEDLLNSEIVNKIIGGERKVAIGYNGIAWFMPDESIAHFMRLTYEWADNGSKVFLCDVDMTGDATGALSQMTEIYKQLKQPLHLRPISRLKELIQPWRLDEPGFMPLEDWYGLEIGKKIQKEATDTLAKDSSGIQGAILFK